MAIMLAPILAIIVRDNKKEEEKQKRREWNERWDSLREENTNDRQRRWFRTMGEINRQSIPNYGRTIPPPPPISQNRRERLLSSEELEIELRKYKLKNFKFLKG
jgi:hypothetical protein